MRVVGIGGDGSFTEYKKTGFELNNEEKILETWFERNPQAILENEQIFVIGRQVQTNLGTWIDLLGLDKTGNTVIIELKRDRTPRDTIAQALEYCAFVAELNSDQLEEIFRTYINDSEATIAQYHKEFFDLADDETVVLMLINAS